MIDCPPYMIVISAPSSSVGRSTLACNLAVYLRALDENLPVACVSTDAAALAAMFALSGSSAGSLAALQRGGRLSDQLAFGEFGIEYCPVGLVDENVSPDWLRRELAGVHFDGILILDVEKEHPLFQAALWAADQLLVLIKDPAALGSVSEFLKLLLSGGGSDEQLWLLQSELGAEGSYRDAVNHDDFLRFAAEERGLQVRNEKLLADAQVRMQAAAIAKPVLTRVAGSALHGQLMQLSSAFLEQRTQRSRSTVRIRRWLEDGLLPARAGRVGLFCPLCGKVVLGESGHYLESFPCRKRQLLHAACFSALLKGSAAADFQGSAGLSLVQPGAAQVGNPGELRLQSLDRDLEVLADEMLPVEACASWEPLLQCMTGRRLSELYAERILISAPFLAEEALSSEWYGSFVALRKRLRSVCQAEKL